MKRTAIFLALTLGALAAFGQGPAPDSKKDQAVTTLNDKGAVASPVIQSTPADVSRIKAPTTLPSGRDDREKMVNLWKLIQSGCWAMIPLGVMSGSTFTMWLVNLFSLRRCSITSAHSM